MFEEHPLDPTIHDRSGFTCGVPVLDEYLRRYAVQQRRRGITSVYVLAESRFPKRILGYYTLSAAEADAAQLSENDRKTLPRYPIPCFRMGRLACRADEQGHGLGKLLLASAVDRCLNAREQVAAYALIVDAKNRDAKAFYEHMGFKPFSERALTLYLPLGS